MNLKDKAVLVTGGASGLGAATAQMIAKQGGHPVILDMNAEAGEALASELGGLFMKTDVSNEAEVQAIVAAALEKFGHIHGAVNCAGIGNAAVTAGKKGPFPLDIFERVIKVNLVGTFNVIRLAAQAMMENEPGESGERGVLVNTASVAAFDGQVGQAAYSASKGGIVGMTLPIARDLSSIVRRGTERGEVRADADPHLVMQMIVGPLLVVTTFGWRGDVDATALGVAEAVTRAFAAD